MSNNGCGPSSFCIFRENCKNASGSDWTFLASVSILYNVYSAQAFWQKILLTSEERQQRHNLYCLIVIRRIVMKKVHFPMNILTFLPKDWKHKCRAWDHWSTFLNFLLTIDHPHVFDISIIQQLHNNLKFTIVFLIPNMFLLQKHDFEILSNIIVKLSTNR